MYRHNFIDSEALSVRLSVCGCAVKRYVFSLRLKPQNMSQFTTESVKLFQTRGRAPEYQEAVEIATSREKISA